MDLTHQLKMLRMGKFCNRNIIINNLLIYNCLDESYGGFCFRIWQ
jgi:hypothetical protein